MEWIKVSEKLPNKGDMIIYCSKTKRVSSIGIYWDDPDDPRGPIPSRPGWLKWENVTHWMELPEVQKD